MLLSRIKGFMYTSSKYHPDAGGGPRRHPRCVSKGVVPLLCALIIYPTSEGTTNLTRGTDERGWRDVLGALRGSALRRGLPPHERRRGHLRRGPHHRRGACVLRRPSTAYVSSLAACHLVIASHSLRTTQTKPSRRRSRRRTRRRPSVGSRRPRRCIAERFRFSRRPF